MILDNNCKSFIINSEYLSAIDTDRDDYLMLSKDVQRKVLNQAYLLARANDVSHQVDHRIDEGNDRDDLVNDRDDVCSIADDLITVPLSDNESLVDKSLLLDHSDSDDEKQSSAEDYDHDTPLLHHYRRRPEGSLPFKLIWRLSPCQSLTRKIRGSDIKANDWNVYKDEATPSTSLSKQDTNNDRRDDHSLESKSAPSGKTKPNLMIDKVEVLSVFDQSYQVDHHVIVDVGDYYNEIEVILEENCMEKVLFWV